MAWWTTVDPQQRVRYEPVNGPNRGVVLTALGCLLAIVAFAWWKSESSLALVWLAAVVLAAIVVYRLALGYVAVRREDRAFVREFGRRVVFGRPGTAETGERAEQLTADLLTRYLTRLPGVRIFHGLSLSGSVFADIDHAILCGRRLVLIESKVWLPGHYTVDETGTVWRNGHSFRGGAMRLPEGLEAYRELLPDVEVCGALLLYPNREGEITTGESGEVLVPPMVPEQFVRRIGDWLAAEGATVNREVFRTVAERLVAGSPERAR